MNFLAPLFLAGAAAVALPILLHLIRRTEREKTPFSSLMFLQPTPPQMTKRSRLENILLLILRCLVLMLVAFAFGRPYLQQAIAPPAQKTERVRTVVLVDTSASLRRDDLWAQAKTRAAAALREAGPADEVALIAFDRQPRVLVDFTRWTSAASGERANLAVTTLEAESPSWSSTHLGSAMLRGVELLEEKAEAQLRKRLVVVSDFQDGAKLDGLQGYEWPKGVEVRLDQINARSPGNASLQLGAELASGTGTTDGSLKVRVNNSADARKDQFRLQRSDGGPGAEAYVPSGQSRVVTLAAGTNALAGTNGLRLSLAGDDQAFDNTLFIQTRQQDKVRVLFLGNDDPKDSAGLSYYLGRAFPETRTRKVELGLRPATTPLTAADFKDTALVVGSTKLNAEQAAWTKQALAAGVTVLLALPDTESTASLATILGGTAPAAADLTGSYSLFGRIDFQHPLFAPFADPRFSDFTRIHFWRARQLLTNSLPGARVVAAYDSGDPALLEIPSGRASLFVLTSTWTPTDSQLALSSKFVPLLSGLLDYGRARQSVARQFFVGDAVPLPTNGVTGALSVVRPDGKREALPTGSTQFAATTEPGFYKVEGLPEPLAFAVNLAPEESRTAPMTADALSNLGVPVKSAPTVLAAAPQDPKATLMTAAVELEGRQKLWRWALMAALGFVLIETWLAGRLSFGGKAA